MSDEVAEEPEFKGDIDKIKSVDRRYHTADAASRTIIKNLTGISNIDSDDIISKTSLRQSFIDSYINITSSGTEENHFTLSIKDQNLNR